MDRSHAWRQQAAHTQALLTLAAEEAAAWREYLTDTRNQILERYEQLEPWAWNRLGVKLAAIQTRRKKLEEAAA